LVQYYLFGLFKGVSVKFIKIIVLCSLLLSGSVFALEKEVNQKEKEVVYTYINVDANVKDTPILLDGKEIGKTPLRAYKIEAGKDLELKLLANKDYYEKDLIKTINVRKNIQKDFMFNFEKAKAKLFLVGDKAHLFIDNKFIKALNEENRIIETDAGENVELYLEDNYKTRTLFKDLKAKQFYEISYTLLNIPKDIRLLTTTIENLMWEDTKHAAGVQLDWEQAKIYCEDLNVAGLKGWKIPTLKQLERLQEKYKDKMYHGHGKTFYWSDKLSDSKNGIWNYASAVNFETGRVTTPVKEIATGYVRCVKELGDTTEIVVEEETKDGNKEEIPDYGYDPELTKDLKKYMLK